jgi:dienelactone hydrolase
LSDVEFYHVGNPNTDKAIIMVPDVFGWDSGRIRRYADLLSEIAGYVVVPKLLQPPFEEGTDGDGLPPTFDVSARWSDFVSYMSQFKYNEVLKPKIDGLINHLRSNGVSKIGLMGFCFGGWVICNIVRDHGDVISCAVIPHPSIGLEEKIYGGDCVALVDNVKCPVLLMPAGNDPPTYLPGGDVSICATALIF